MEAGSMIGQEVTVFDSIDVKEGEFFLGYVGREVKEGKKESPFPWESCRFGEVDKIGLDLCPAFASKREILLSGAKVVDKFGRLIDEIPKRRLIDTKLKILKPEPMKSTCITKDDIGKFFVLNKECSSGRIMTYGEMFALDIPEIGGWYKIDQLDVDF